MTKYEIQKKEFIVGLAQTLVKHSFTKSFDYDDLVGVLDTMAISEIDQRAENLVHIAMVTAEKFCDVFIEHGYLNGRTGKHVNEMFTGMVNEHGIPSESSCH